MRGDHDDRGALAEQGVRAMFELACGVGLGVDVGDLLQLEGALARDGIVQGAAKIEEGFGVAEVCGDALQFLLQGRQAIAVQRGK